jgi:hypothetical protein
LTFIFGLKIVLTRLSSSPRSNGILTVKSTLLETWVWVVYKIKCFSLYGWNYKIIPAIDRGKAKVGRYKGPKSSQEDTKGVLAALAAVQLSFILQD